MKCASIGTISHGTLRDQDLLEALMNELEYQIGRNGNTLAQPEHFNLRNSLADLMGEAQDCFGDNGEIDEDHDMTAQDVIASLCDALNTFAGPYCYFGAHEGDGSDFGFWPARDSIEELPTLESGVEHETQDEDYKEVNDHGNVTVFSADGNVILELV